MVRLNKRRVQTIAVFSDYELSGPAQRRKTGGTEYIKGCARNAEWNQRLAQGRYSNRPGTYDNANMEKESRDAHPCLTKAFSSSYQEIEVVHISKLEFFVQVIEKRQGKIIPIFIISCRHESTNNEAYSYDNHNQETR